MYYAYLRVSHDEAALDGVSLAVQQREAIEYFDALPDPDKQWGKLRHPLKERRGFFVDRAQSAGKMPLLGRRSGGYLKHVLQPGDHLILWRLDRGFSSVEDLQAAMPSLAAMGVTLHFVREGIVLNCADVKELGGVVDVEQWRSVDMGSRRKTALAIRKAQGRPVNQEVPIGFKVAKALGKKWFTPDEEAVDLMELIVALRDGGMPWDEIGDRVERMLSEREGRPYVPKGGRYTRKGRHISRPYGKSKLIRWYRAYYETIKPLLETV
jgi:DNA invertase Pin-like site-specific DNA recombinase